MIHDWPKGCALPLEILEIRETMISFDFSWHWVSIRFSAIMNWKLDSCLFLRYATGSTAVSEKRALKESIFIFTRYGRLSLIPLSFRRRIHGLSYASRHSRIDRHRRAEQETGIPTASPSHVADATETRARNDFGLAGIFLLSHHNAVLW